MLQINLSSVLLYIISRGPMNYPVNQDGSKTNILVQLNLSTYTPDRLS